MDRIIIRPMAEEDLEQVEAIEKTLQGEIWSAQGFRDSINRPEACFLVIAEETGSGTQIFGYCCGTHVLDEAEIVNVAVRADLRGSGFGKQLLNAYISRLADLGVHHIVLEVREGNIPARRLYEGAGFKTAGIRKHFYSFPEENAVTMCLDM